MCARPWSVNSVADYEPEYDDPTWEAGFEVGRSIVVSRFGPWLRVFPRPKRHTRRFWQQIHTLPIHEWEITLEPLRLGSFCRITAGLNILFQPTLRFAREHVEHLPRLDVHIRNSYEILLKDRAALKLRCVEKETRWIEQGFAEIERLIAEDVNELLALRNIQCRSRCRIEARFENPDALEPEDLAPWSRHRTVYLELLRRQRKVAEEVERAQSERILAEQRARLQREQELLELQRQEEMLRKQQLEREIERLRAELAAEEIRVSEQRESEARQAEAQILHAARLRQLETEADIQEKTRRAAGLNDMENHLKREIELLALERQRLLLEEEVREVRIAKARGWVIHAKKRFPLGERDTPSLEDPGMQVDESTDES